MEVWGVIRQWMLHVFLISALLMMAGCGGSSETADEQTPDIRLSLDLANATARQADELFNPGVVGYGLLALDKPGNPLNAPYFGLDQYLGATNSRSGYLVIDELSNLLNSMTQLADDSELNLHLAEVNDAVDHATQRGARVVLRLSCALPDALSKWSGYDHNILSGLAEDSEQPLYACAPLRDETARNTWRRLMETTARYFGDRYGDRVVFIIFDEPETYFGGSFEELYDLFETTADGLRSGNPTVKIGGLTTSSYNMEKLKKANLAYHPDPDLTNSIDESYFTSTAETLATPLIEAWLDRLDQRNLPIDIIQTKRFDGNPAPADSAFWVEEVAEIERWLQANPQAHSGPVEMFYTDFPGWHTVCAEDQQGDRESIWDSEYFPAWYASTYIAMKAYQQDHTGSIGNLEPLLAYLIEYGYPSYFHTSCERDLSRPAGFNGSISLNAGLTSIGGQEVKTYIPKPILNVLHLLTGFDGDLIPLQSGDRNVHTVAAHDSGSQETSILLSYFLPSEVNYHTAGITGYQMGHLFRNDYGVSYDAQELTSITPNPTLQSYLDHPDHPQPLIRDLLEGPQTLAISDLGVTPEYAEFLTAAREAGMQNRSLLAQAQSGRYKTVSVNLQGLAPGNYQVVRQAVDRDHGNANSHRYAIHAELESAFVSGGTTALAEAAGRYQILYGEESTRLATEQLAVTNQGGSLTLSLKPNSVHLITLRGPL